MNNTKVILSLCATGMLIGCSHNNKQLSKPNIILIVADDLGYGDLGCYGSSRIETPHLDALAANGARLTQFYSASAVCTPTRASLLTGNYPLRFNIRQYFPKNGYLPEESVSIAEVLQTNGYFTAHIGKWHLGGLSGEYAAKRKKGEKTDPGPNQHGFEYYFSMLEGDTAVPDLLGQRQMYRSGGKYLISNDERLPSREGFITNLFTDEAIRLVDSMKNSRNPFFINLWYKEPHTPYEPAPEPHYSKYLAKNYTEPINQNFHRGHNAPGDEINYNSMVSILDASIGRLVSQLKKQGLYENTLIIFTSDNGPSYRGSPAPWSGGKADLHEGGIRVPMIACWLGKISPGSVQEGFGHSNDLFNTFCEAARIPAFIKDGVSILPQLTGQKAEVSRGMVFWQLDQAIDPWGNIWYPQPGTKPTPYATCAVRSGEWKLLTDSIVPLALYNLKLDPLEQDNLIGKHPDKEMMMLDSLKVFLADPRLNCGRAPDDPRSL